MNILIIKTGALGDVLRTSFVAQALKDKYKNKNPKIYWIVESSGIPLLTNNPYIYKIVKLDDKESISKIKFDIVINLEESIELCKFASFLNTKEIIGFYFNGRSIVPSDTAKEWFNMSMLGKKPLNNILKKKNKKTHRQIMSEIIDVKYNRYEPFLKMDDNQKKFAKNFLKKHNLNREDLIIGINSGSSDRWPKALPIKKTIELIDNINKEYGEKVKILLFGGPNEIERNKEIIKLSKSPIIDTGCKNNLFEFCALLSICRIIITSDSLGLHIALALKRKTICLVGPTSSNELDMYDIGYKVVAKSKCLCCYKPKCKSMDYIDIKEVIRKIELFIKQDITVLVTAFKEPKIGKAIESLINQKTNYKYKILISAPDKETLNIAKKYAKGHNNLKVVKDPGKGKSYAINMILSSIKTDILILTDGDVFVNDIAIDEICNLFLDSQIGCVTGKPTPLENRDNKYGYWANFLFNAAHYLRKKAFIKENFIECSGYLFAFRQNKIKQIPLDVAEDAVIPYYFWNLGYKVGYAEKAEVYVKNPTNWNDWIKQKIRTSKGHETLTKYVNIKTTPRVKSFQNEFFNGILLIIRYPHSLKEVFWTLELILARIYMWIKVFIDTKILNKQYSDAWERVESTK
ncbi:MAG: glycosyltransferase [Candidatus Pacearchaeota archaeon]